jgi:CspA family cold shock protein
MSSVTTYRNWIEASEPVAAVIRGTVKWFDPARGFGFVQSAQAERDVFLHVNVLRNFGLNSIVDGSCVEIRVQRGARGPQAVELLSVEGPGPSAAQGAEPAAADFVHPIDGSLPFLPARVKWFDRARGFGFANVFGEDADVFIHVDVLHRGGMADLKSGEAISLRATRRADGPFAVEVRPWKPCSTDRTATGAVVKVVEIRR